MAKNTNAASKERFSFLRGGKRTERTEGVDFYDYNLLAVVILLTCFGLVMLYSTSAYEASVDYGNDMRYFARQALVSAMFFVVMIYGSRMDYHWFSKFAFPGYLLANVLLIATKFVGTTINGARRWIYIGGISFQPAEFAKLAVILFFPTLIVRMGWKFRKVKAPMIVFGLGLMTAFFTYRFTDNLSTAIIILGIAYVLIFIAHPRPKRMLQLTIVFLIVVAIALLVIRNTNILESSSSFRMQRILTWLHPEENQDEGGYQVMQALYAIGSGGLFGKGLGNSAQKLGALPEAQNDMIFSIICEELGIIGAMIVLVLFAFLLARLVFIATNAPDLLGSLIATGIFAHISLQVVLNIAVVLNVIPTTGITLPFVSYGGTSIAFLMMEMMLALSVSNQIRVKST
jgi:cell division protein FtsW